MSTLNTTNLKNASSGSNNIVLNTDGTTTIAAPSNIIKSGTAVASTSGTSIDFTSIPSWVKRVTVMFQGMSLSGTNDFLFQLGDSGGIENTNYLSAYTQFGTTSLGTANSTSGFILSGGGATRIIHGSIQFTNLTGNAWTAFGGSADETGTRTCFTAGSKTLSSTLDRVRITASGADTFDAGTINILYEG